MSLAKYSPKVSANNLVLVATSTTCNLVSTKSTDVLYTEESDANDEKSDAGCSISYGFSDGVVETVKDSVERFPTEIMELDKIGFDDTLDLDETEDM